MVESNLVGGSQDYGSVPLVRGQSVTDACLAWEKTLPLLQLLSDSVEARRRLRG
jgi:3-deoxy-7-phosphoheptulonate synthase